MKNLDFVQPTYGLVGDGRLATHFKEYFTRLGLQVVQWSRRIEQQEGHKPHEVLSRADAILVLIQDAAIEPWVVRYLEQRQSISSLNPNQKIIHCSGSLESPLLPGFHPLMSFGKELYSLEMYERVSFVCEESAIQFKDVFPTLKNPHYTIAGREKAFYHALCVLGGNFTVLLWQKLFSDLEKRLGIPAAAALPYLERVTANVHADYKTALTGPIPRKDYVTLDRDLSALRGDQYEAIFRVFMETFLPVTNERTVL